MGWKDVTPSEAVEAADWIGPRLHPFAKDVGSVVPTGFAAYARIFHPANQGWLAGLEVKSREVRWSEIAAANGRVVHPEMQFQAINTPVPGRAPLPEGWNGPGDGTLDARQLKALADLLAAHTTTPNACCLCLWEGYGYGTGSIAWVTAEYRPISRISPRYWLALLRFRRLMKKAFAVPPRMPPPRPTIPPPPLPPPGDHEWPFPKRKRVRLPAREYLLFRGSIAQAVGWQDGPNLWWPDDRAWCVASEIDFSYTYVGGSKELIDEILRHPDLEALPATVEDGITYDSDKINT